MSHRIANVVDALTRRIRRASSRPQASAALTKLYPKPHAAEAAGYFRFNNEDSSGAISGVARKQVASNAAWMDLVCISVLQAGVMNPEPITR